jgi:nitrate reductase NapA
MTGRIPDLVKASGTAAVELNEQDAFSLAVKDGETVEIISRCGTLRATARVTSSPRRGVVFAAFWGVRLLINQVVADHVDPASKEPEFKVTAVRVRKVDSGAS